MTSPPATSDDPSVIGHVRSDVAGPPLDLRLLPAAAAAWGAAWLAPALAPAVSVPGSALGGVLALMALVVALRRRVVGAAVLAAALGVGAAAGFGAAMRVAAVGAGPIPDLADSRAAATVELRIAGDPVARTIETRGGARELVTVPVVAEHVLARGTATDVRSPLLVLADDPAWTVLIPGQGLRVSGLLAPPRPRSPTAAVLRVRGPPPSAAAAPLRDRAAADVRAGLRSAVAGLGPDERGLVPGLVLGDTSGMDAALTEDFRAAGLSHVVAVSGANLALLLGAVLGLARWFGVRLRALPALAVGTLALFVLVARPEPSLLRASVMGLVGVLGLAAGRAGRAAPALFAAVVVLVLVDPWLARSFGFALSVSATAGLIFLAPRWRDALARRLPRWLATVLAVPAAAQTVCAPIVVLFAAEVSVVAVAANVVALPAVPPAMLLGVLAAVAWPVCPPLARLVGELAGLPAWWIVTVARAAAALPGATVPWPPGTRGALALAVLTAAVLAWSAGRAPPGSPRFRRRGAAALAAALAVALLWRPAVPMPGPFRGPWPPADWALVACDVGQGDALLLRAGERSAVVVDAGPDPALVRRCLHEFGVRRVPYLLLTHFHADHADGLPGVLRGREVAEIGVSPLADPPGQVARVEGLARAAGIPVTRPGAGERRQLGDLRWRVLWPRRLIAEGSPSNNASVVVLAELPGGLRVLLTGDVEPAAQAALRRAEPGLRADVLKVPHHGSAHQDPALLTSLGARVAIASAGAGNDYGHPAPSTLALLTGAGMHVVRTDTDGAVALVVTDGRLRVVTRR